MKKVHQNIYHQKSYEDHYHWLRLSDAQKNAPTPDVQTKEVLTYLSAENDYFQEMTAHTKSLQKTLFSEMKSRIHERDSSVPYLDNGYWYQTKYEQGKQYPIYIRYKDPSKKSEEILLDANVLAENFEYYHIGGYTVSPDNTLMAYAEDTVGRRQYTLKIKNLQTGELLPQTIENCTGEILWDGNKQVFYTAQHPETLRSHRVYKHHISSETSTDVLVYEEKDEAFSVSVGASSSKNYLILNIFSTTTTECWVKKISGSDEDFTVFQPRQKGLEYSIDHHKMGDKEQFFILTNKNNAVNFKLMRSEKIPLSLSDWQEFIPHRKDVLLEDFTLFEKFIVLEEREQGLNKIRVKNFADDTDYYMSFAEETYTAEVIDISSFDYYKGNEFRYCYHSLTTPYSVFSFDTETQEKHTLKTQKVLGDFDAENYCSERLWATSRDGTKIAISTVYHKKTKINEDTPFLLYGYGAYGYTVDPNFSTTRLSLLDRGFVFGIVHIRGGEYLGRDWYENGKMLSKKNTFYDFIDCSKHLIEKGYTSPAHLYAMGGSAGGLLMGVVINEAPEMYNGVVAAVPFVDVINTMMDESIPLTTGEYEEWGNPNEKKYFDYIMSYAPYENIKKQVFPNLLVTTGFHDSQVQYWEPAKWVAKIRDLQKKSPHKIYLYTDMQTGHGGASGRFDALKEIAREYAFLLDLENQTTKK